MRTGATRIADGGLGKDLRSDTRPAACGGPVAPNKPNWWEGTVRHRLDTPLRETKPIRRPIVPNKPNSGPGTATGETKGAKQTQFVPAWRNRWGKPHATRGAAERNKPNWPERMVRHRLDAPLRETEPIRRRIVRNEANWAGTSRQTKPISGRAVRDKRREGRRGRRSKRLRQTKPISARGTDPMDLESATGWRPHPLVRAGSGICLPRTGRGGIVRAGRRSEPAYPMAHGKDESMRLRSD